MPEEKLPPLPYMKYALEICGGVPSAAFLLIALAEFSPKQLRKDHDGRLCAVRSIEWWAEYTGYGERQIQNAFNLLEEKRAIFKKQGINPYTKKKCLWVRFRHKLYEDQSRTTVPDQSRTLVRNRSRTLVRDLYIILSNDNKNHGKKREKVNDRKKAVLGATAPKLRFAQDSRRENLRLKDSEDSKGNQIKRIQKEKSPRKGTDVAREKMGKSFDGVFSSEKIEFKFSSRSFWEAWKKLHSKHLPEVLVADPTGKEIGYVEAILPVLRNASNKDSDAAIGLLDEIISQWDDVCDFICYELDLEEVPVDPTIGFLAKNIQGTKKKYFHVAIDFIQDDTLYDKLQEMRVAYSQ